MPLKPTEIFECLERHRVRYVVASLDDVIRSKEAANRPKDQRSLPLLRQLAEELRRRR